MLATDASQGADLYVAPGGSGNGTSWTSAYGSLEEAIANADPADQIFVRTGSYAPTTAFAGAGRERTYSLPAGVRVMGGFPNSPTATPSDRSPGLYVTSLSGILGSDPEVDRSYHVVTAVQVDDESILDGFVVRDGLADGDGFIPALSNYGGGFLALPLDEGDDNNPRIQNCVFTSNAAWRGGGAASHGTGFPFPYPRPSFRCCEFAANEAVDSGGGAHCHLAEIEVISSLLHDNAAGDGGGLSAARQSLLRVVATTVTKNTAVLAAGAAGIRVGHQTGGLEMGSSIVVGNTIGGQGTTFQSQVKGTGAGGLYGLAIEYSCVTAIDTTAFPVGNIDDDPLFVDPAASNFRLQSGSPCIDVGDPSPAAVPADTSDVDDDGNETEPVPDRDVRDRIRNAVVDMGAFEWRCLGDLDGDGDVDNADLATLLGFWGSNCWHCEGELTGDFTVGSADLAALLGAWGACSSNGFAMMEEASSEFAQEAGDVLPTPGSLAALLGFSSVEELAAWLSELPASEVSELLLADFGSGSGA